MSDERLDRMIEAVAEHMMTLAEMKSEIATDEVVTASGVCDGHGGVDWCAGSVCRCNDGHVIIEE